MLNYYFTLQSYSLFSTPTILSTRYSYTINMVFYISHNCFFVRT